MFEAISMILFVACPLILSFLFLTGKARVFWTTTMGTIGGVIAISEVTSKLTNGHSISQLFWDYSVLHPGTAWLVSGLLLFGWVALLIHLDWKLITKKK